MHFDCEITNIIICKKSFDLFTLIINKIIKGKIKVKNFEYDGTQNDATQSQAQPQNKNSQANII